MEKQIADEEARSFRNELEFGVVWIVVWRELC